MLFFLWNNSSRSGPISHILERQVPLSHRHPKHKNSHFECHDDFVADSAKRCADSGIRPTFRQPFSPWLIPFLCAARSSSTVRAAGVSKTQKRSNVYLAKRKVRAHQPTMCYSLTGCARFLRRGTKKSKLRLALHLNIKHKSFPEICVADENATEIAFAASSELQLHNRSKRTEIRGRSSGIL